MNKRKAKIHGYHHRAQILKRFGFKNYKAYLLSELWLKIRAAKLRKDPRCFKCGRLATQVHHSYYSLVNMLGHGFDGLYSVCGKCHHWAEFDEGEKTTLIRATSKLESGREFIRRWNAAQWELDRELRERLERED